MRGRGRRSERSDRVLDPVLRQGHDVHIALDDDDAARSADRGPRLEKPVELAALLEQRSLGRVEVLGAAFSFPLGWLAFVQHAAAESDHGPALIENGKHDAVAKSVVASPALAVDHQPRVLQRLVAVVGEDALQVLPPVGGITDAEARRDFSGEPSALQILNRTRSVLELLAVIVAGSFHDGV